jgi:hypothetical protein
MLCDETGLSRATLNRRLGYRTEAMSDDLVARLRDAWDERERQLAEDERVALAAIQEHSDPSGRWALGGDSDDNVRPADPTGNDWVAVGPRDGGLGDATAEHIARHDPARVLAEVERRRRDIAAKRAIIDEYEQAQAYYEQHRAAPAGEVTGLWTAVRALAEAEGVA